LNIVGLIAVHNLYPQDYCVFRNHRGSLAPPAA
jgi:hypothetical protein